MDTLYPTRLSSSQIRLLHILPSEFSESPVSCELRQYEIDNIPAYEALSYCWGDSTERCEIVCNGTAYLVTASLWDALVRLRLKNEVRIVWADALCIAQSDDEEKSSQVRRMDSIFYRARRVVVWLGHVETEHAMGVKRLFESLECISGDPVHYDSHWCIPDVAASFGDSLPWRALDIFFSNPWFQRVWCIQEIRLSSDSIFYWGTEELSRYVAVRLAGWALDQKYEELPTSYLSMSPYAWRMNGPLDQDKCRLLSALRTYRACKATDPRDKVYGILGLMEIGEERHILKIDYEKSTQEVYHDVATAIIRWTGDLAIFAHVHHSEDYDGDSGYESWIPQWDNSLHVPPRQIGSALFPLTRPHGKYNMVIPRIDTPRSHHRRLMVSGLICQTVWYTGRLIEETLDKFARLHGDDGIINRDNYPRDIFLQYWRETVSQEPPQGTDVSLEMLSMARTLTTGVAARGETLYQRANEEEIAIFAQSFLAYIRLLHAWHDSSDGDGFTIEDLGQHGADWKLFASIAELRCFQRKVFRAQNGSFGLGPACLRENDVVVVLEGAYTPCALRPKGDSYLFLGQVYIDEIMHGELIREIEEGKRERLYFSLQ